MSQKYPDIRIKYAWLLADATAKPLQEYWGPDKKNRSTDEYEEIARQYRDFWQPHEKKILKGMYDLVGLQYRANVIDVYVAPWFYAFSDPLVLGAIFKTEEKLVVNLTHELLHRLFMDNTSAEDGKNLDLWKKLFGEHEFVTLVHIPVYIMLHALLKDVLKKPDWLKEEKHDSEAYEKAWKYVEEHGYEVLLEKLKKTYAS